MSESLNVSRLSAWRSWSDRITRWVIGTGGAAVIVAIGLIFAYLLWVVAPLLWPGSIDDERVVNVIERNTLLTDVSENGEVLMRLSDSGIVEFYDTASGNPVAAFALGSPVVKAQRVYPTVDIYALVDQQNRLSFIQTEYLVTFKDDVRALTPKLKLPFANATLNLQSADLLDIAYYEDQLVVVAAAQGGNQIEQLRVPNVEPGFALGPAVRTQINSPTPLRQLLMGPRNQWFYALDADGKVSYHNVQGNPTLLGTTQLQDVGENVVMGAVLGRYSLLVANAERGITQWGLFNDPLTGRILKPMRRFETSAPVIRFVSEPRRKGFASVDTEQNLTLHYPTSGRNIDSVRLSFADAQHLAISPRSDLLIAASGNNSLTTLKLHNEHPEVSIATLWMEIWYEGYAEPQYSWQSSSADNDFEPKFSLTPLAFGTLKAAFYALLFAVPISIMGAIYTAYFMSPSMRAWVKPGIEIMAALPTVILGFIGGLWLAPIIESYLSSVLAIFVVLPLLLSVLALGWAGLPERFSKPFAGWYGLLVTPIIVMTVYWAFDVGPFLEDTFFGGDSKTWFREVMGLNYDQRNALVVGIIMGLAVIPTIFSIAEDAIYGVPNHLTNGSLALGATPWQTLMRVVLLTASPGIFSAVMIGMGRAIGETMIVLMATGNTPLMDFNIFEGMRTFAANIAVELPESEVDSSHYRILFLAALVLFMLTFVFNTLAEVVRQRLRARYGSL